MRKMWSKNQLKNTISGASAEVVEALNGQDVKVKTIEQSEANLELTPSSMSEAGGLSGLGLTKYERFVRIQQINSELHIIVNVAMANETESSITIPGGANLYGYIKVPSSIASKIYDESGKNFTQTHVSGKDKVSLTPCIINVANTSYNGVLKVWHNATDEMYIAIMVSTNASVPSGSQAYFSGRVQLSLL